MKFHLENVGKITSADIELKPLTIFIGQNGTGKTYAASAIWSIVRYIKTQPVNALLSKSTYTHYKNIVDTVLQNWKDFNKTSFTLDAKDLETLAQDIQKTLLSNGSALLTNTFSADFFQHAILQFDIPTYQSFNVTLSLKPSTPLNDTYHEDKKSYQKINICFEVDNKNQINQTLLIPIPNDTLNNATIFNKNNAIIDSLTNAILRKIVQLVAFQQNLNLLEQDVYIPAARTGLMFGLHDIVQSTLERDNAQLSFLSNKEVSSNSSKLTAPIKKFISDLNRSSRFGLWHLDSEETPLTKLMEGSINFDEEKSSFEFRPKNLKSTLPLAASSSLVTELAAFDILCSDVIFNAPEFLIFEEPEAHLHLSAQRDIAKIIVSLVNQGTHVLLTSHSDTFLQQLNNLILLHRLKETNMPYQLGIKDNEMIDEEKVALYDFTNQEGRTMVKNIPCSKYGFIAPSLNEVLKSLQLETTDILNKIDESE